MLDSITIDAFQNTASQIQFAKPYITKHFAWDKLVKDLNQKTSFPHLMIASHHARPVGMILLHTNIEAPINKHKLAPANAIWIYRLYIAPDYRQQGLGKKLVQGAEIYTKNHAKTAS